MNNPAFMEELKSWIRFNDQEATQKGDGLSGRTTGNPSIPRWLGNLLSKLLFRAQPENEKNTRYIRSSAGIAVFVSDVDDKAHWVEAGRCYERFALQATVLGIRNAFVNQPVEEASLRPNFVKAVGLKSGRPDLVVRFGHGAEMPSSLRRPLEAAIVWEPLSFLGSQQTMHKSDSIDKTHWNQHKVFSSYLAHWIFRSQVEEGNHGKIVAIDIETGAFEVADDILPATNRLFERFPDAQPWIVRIGYRAVDRFGSRSLKKTVWFTA
jgi:hypothetical protein